MVSQRSNVIYTRYSSDLQRSDSCEDQERNVRGVLDRRGIPDAEFSVIKDEAVSGTKENRAGFTQLKNMVMRGEVGLLAVDDLSRLTRGTDALGFIEDVVFHGGRFISASENIDTAEDGWELLVQVKGIANNATNRDHGSRVRRGHVGRIKDGNGSAGDYPFGYRSELADPDWQAGSRRGQKPKMRVVVNEQEADCVRRVFHWFTELRWSISRIARELNRLQVPKGHRGTKPGWGHQLVRKMLGNSKYAGTWIYGRTRTIRDSKGRKKQVAVQNSEVTTVDRPGLRIIDDSTWGAAQLRLAEVKGVYGLKEGQKPRGPRVHHTAVCPSSLLGGLLFCGTCGSRLVYKSGHPYVHYGCPNHSKGTCRQTTRAPRERTERALVEFLEQELRGIPGWMDEVMSSLRARLRDLGARVPQEVEAKTRARDELQRKIDNITAAIETSGAGSAHLVAKLEQYATDVARLDAEVVAVQKLVNAPSELPPDTWVAEQLADLAGLLRRDVGQAAFLLRQILGRVTVEEVVAPGKKRGFVRLRFRIDAWGVASRVLAKAKDVPPAAFPTPSAGDVVYRDVVLDVGGPTRMDTAAPLIADMRAHGRSWREVAEATGLNMGNAYMVWKRYADAQPGEDAPRSAADGLAAG